MELYTCARNPIYENFNLTLSIIIRGDKLHELIIESKLFNMESKDT